MILVDSSVWIDFFRAAGTPQVELLDKLLGRVPLAVGDLIAAEVLQGIRDAREFKRVKALFSEFEQVDIAGYALAVKASEHYRTLRAKGIIVRKTIGTLIATRCIVDGLTLLHADQDFEPFVKHLGLRVANAA
jgi:hypothetical protein